MRIARVLTRLNLGGPARQALASDPLLAERGHVVRLFTGVPEPGEGDLLDTFRGRGLGGVRIPSLRRRIAPLREARALRVLRRELARFAPDVVHTHASKAGTLGRRAAAKLPDESRVARVHTFHGHVLEGYFPGFVSRRLQALERRLARRTDRILAVSHGTAADLLRLGVVEEERLVVVPPGIDLAPLLGIVRSAAEPRAGGALRRRLGVGDNDVLVGVIGRLAEVKQPWRALDVYAMLCERYPNLHVVFVGDGGERNGLERRIRATGGQGMAYLHMIGAVHDMSPVLEDLDLVLQTSRMEGLPVALIEAAAAGLPVVATDVGGVAEVVTHGRTGLLGTTDRELADGLAPLLGDEAERRAMGRRARLRVADRHSAAALADRLEAVYDIVVQERGR